MSTTTATFPREEDALHAVRTLAEQSYSLGRFELTRSVEGARRTARVVVMPRIVAGAVRGSLVGAVIGVVATATLFALDVGLPVRTPGAAMADGMALATSTALFGACSGGILGFAWSRVRAVPPAPHSAPEGPVTLRYEGPRSRALRAAVEMNAAGAASVVQVPDD